MGQEPEIRVPHPVEGRLFSLLCVAVPEAGIGADTASFSIVEGALLRPLPFGDPARLVDILDESRREARRGEVGAVKRGRCRRARIGRHF